MTKTYPLHESAGLVITGKLAEAINGIAYSGKDRDPEYMDDGSAYEAVNAADAPVYACSDFEGEARSLKEDGEIMEYAGDAIYYMPSRKSHGLFSAAYGSFDELAAEFHGELADAGYEIPQEVIAEYICEIAGTYSC